MNLLIVDDHVTNLKLLRAQLEAEGHAVCEARDGVEALEILDRQRMDAAICDVQMPRMDGYRLCHEIRAHDRLRNLPIIIYTSTYTAPNDEKLALDLGADKYLKKPVSVETIVTALHEVIAMPHPTPRPEALEEVEVLKEYSERLVAKLEKKNKDLSATVERYDDLFDNAHDLIQSVTPDGHFLYVNRTWRETLGYTEAEVPLLTMPDIIHPGSRTRCLEMFQRILSGDPIDRIEATLITKAGRTLLVEGSAHCKLVEGKVVATRCILRDITERKKAEEAMRESEERFSNAFEYAPIGVGLVSADGRWLKVNRALCDLVGYSEAELLARTFQDITHPESIDVSLENVRRIVAGEIRSYQIEKRYVHARGHIITALLNVSAVRDGQGQPGYFIAQIQDITERKQAEEAIRESEERFSSAFEYAPIGVALVSPDGRWLKVNRALCALVGYSEAELLARTFQDITHPEDLEIDLENVRRVLAGEIHTYQMEKRYVHARGHFVTVLLNVSLVRDGQGHPRYFTSQIQDITERKVSEAALEKAHQELVEASRQAGMAEVATSVLHNVGNVLNSVNVASTCVADSLKKSKSANLSKVVAMIREHEADLSAFLTHDPKGKQIPGYLAQLSDHLAGEQAAALKELEQLQKNIEHIKDIVAMQQSFAKVSGVRETLAASDLVEDALKMNSTSLVRHDIEVIREFGPVPPLTVEKHKVLQILVNLIRNAKHACDETGRPDKRLTVRVANGGGCISIAVIDNGVGIPADNLTRIFSHGFTTKKDGHGFGLHSGALAAKELGGSLLAQSEGPGHGATFTLELPVEKKSQELLCTA